MTIGLELTVRVAEPSQKEAANAFVRQFPAIRDFIYTWERWGNWTTDRNRPILAWLGDEIVGLHAATLARRGAYINSYYLASAAHMRGRGVAGRVVSVSLAEGHRHGLTRLKMKCHHDSPGRAFWEGFGCLPFAEDDVQRWYDVDVRGAPSAEVLGPWMARWPEHEPLPAAAVQAALRSGARLKLGSPGYAQL